MTSIAVTDLSEPMNVTVINTVPFDIPPDHLYPMMRVTAGSDRARHLDALLAEACGIARPKIAYKLAAIEHGDDSTVFIDGLPLKSRLVKTNLRDRRRAFPFIATCGTELDEWSRTRGNALDTFWADTITMLALGTALTTFKEHIRERFGTGPTSTMNPGSLEDWPLEEQHRLFSLLGDAPALIGVRLTEKTMMIPLKSVSGLEFESDTSFYNCLLCPREDCGGRLAPYDRELYEAMFG